MRLQFIYCEVTMFGIRTLYVVALFTFLAQGCRDGAPSTSETSIIGGKKADYQSFMVAIRDTKDNEQFCGGSWIDEGVIVTAAHCIHGQTPKLSVTVGSADKNDFNQYSTFKVRSAVIHPDFNPERDMKNDIALLFIDKIDHSRLTRDVGIIKLNNDRQIPAAGAIVSPIGWGNESSFGALFGENLKQTDVPVVDNITCRKGGKYYDMIEDDFEICAGNFDQGGADACQGDSGGPLVSMVNGQLVLVGIVSWGMDCAQKKRPGVYTRVSKHVDWVKKEIEAYKKPVTLDSASLSKTVASACYASFAGTDLIGGLPYDFNFQPTTLTKVNSGPVHDRSLRNCSFNREGLGLVNVVVAPVNNKVHFFVKVAGENWVGEAKSNFEVDTECATNTENFLIAKYTSSVAMIYKNQKLISSEVAQPVSGTPRTNVTCKSSHVELTYQTIATGNAEKRYLTVEFPKANSAAVTYLMEDDVELIEAENGLKVTHDFVSPTRANVKFEHTGHLDIFSWAISCPFKFHLIGEDGTTHQPADSRPSSYRIAFHHGETQNAVIAEGTGAKFTMVFNSPATPEKLEMCTINEMNLDVN